MPRTMALTLGQDRDESYQLVIYNVIFKDQNPSEGTTTHVFTLFIEKL